MLWTEFGHFSSSYTQTRWELQHKQVIYISSNRDQKQNNCTQSKRLSINSIILSHLIHVKKDSRKCSILATILASQIQHSCYHSYKTNILSIRLELNKRIPPNISQQWSLTVRVCVSPPPPLFCKQCACTMGSLKKEYSETPLLLLFYLSRLKIKTLKETSDEYRHNDVV